MNYFTSSTFRETLNGLLKKRKEGYSSVSMDISQALNDMPDNILRDTNERIIQTPNYRIVKLRVANSGQRLSKADGFRLIYLVSMVSDDVVLLRVFPKRGPKSMVNISNAEYIRLVNEVFNESKDNMLRQVDITKGLAELSQNACLPGDKGDCRL